jgi:hypothetical protein
MTGRRPIAEARVLNLDHLIEGARRVEIDCPATTTGVTSVPGGVLEMTIPQLVTMAFYRPDEQRERLHTARKKGGLWAGCGRPVYYRMHRRTRHRALCARPCANRVVVARRSVSTEEAS